MKMTFRSTLDVPIGAVIPIKSGDTPIGTLTVTACEQINPDFYQITGDLSEGIEIYAVGEEPWQIIDGTDWTVKTRD